MASVSLDVWDLLKFKTETSNPKPSILGMDKHLTLSVSDKSQADVFLDTLNAGFRHKLCVF